MSWWNDFSRHRSSCVMEVESSLQEPQQSPQLLLREEEEEQPQPPQMGQSKTVTCSHQEPPLESALDNSVDDACNASSLCERLYLTKGHSGSASALASHDSTWAELTNRGNGSIPWQTSNSLDGLTMSDRQGVSAAVSAWATTCVQQQHQQLPASTPQKSISVTAAAHPFRGLQVPPAKGDIHILGTHGSSSDAHSNGGSVGIPSHATDHCEPSSLCECGSVVDKAPIHNRSRSVSVSGHNTNGNKRSVVSSDDDDDDDDILYDGVDVGTLSSLIAALQVQDDTCLNGGGNAEIGGGDQLRNADSLNNAHHQSVKHKLCMQIDAGGGVDTTMKLITVQQQPEAGGFTRVPIPSRIFQDPHAGSPLVADFNTLCDSSPHPSMHTYRSNTSGSTISGDASCSSGLFSVSLRESSSGTCSGVNEHLRSGTIPSRGGGELGPLQLTPSALQNVLASFQSVLVERSGNGTLPSSVADLFNVTGQTISSQNGGGSSSWPGSYGSPGEQEDHSSTTSGAPVVGGGHVVVRACGSSTDLSAVSDASGVAAHSSPVMRGRVNCVVAHKLNLDSATRRSHLTDLRGSGGAAPATASLDSTCSSDIYTPMHSARERQGAPLHMCAQEHKASPNPMTERFFAQTVSNVSSMRHVHQRDLSSAAEESFPVLHHHLRTGSEVSLPVAAATYNGGSALHERIDGGGCVTVVDPQRRKLRVPLSAIQMTKALNGRLKTPSLCLLYQSNRCRQGESCYQVHVDPATVERLRTEARDMPCCCFHHGDGNSHLMDLTAHAGRSLDIVGQLSLPITRTAYTAGLQRVLQDEQPCAIVNPSVLCRLHGQPGGCRFGADCRFLHICFQVLQNELASIMADAMAACATSAVMAVAQQRPHQQQQPCSAGGVVAVPGLLPASTHSHASWSHASNATGAPGSDNASPTRHTRPAGEPLGGALSFGDLAEPQPVTLPSPTAQQQQQQNQLQQSWSGSRSPRLVDMSLTSCLSSPSARQRAVAPSLGSALPHHCAATLSTPSAGPHYTLSTLPPQVSPVQTPVSRRSPQQTSTHELSSAACHAQRYTLSAQGNGTHPPYRSPSLTQPPLSSAVASSMRTMPPGWCTYPSTTAATAGGSGGICPPPLAPLQLPLPAAPPSHHQQPMLQQIPQQHQLVHLYPPQHQSTAQQFYIQQLNADGSLSLVPVNIVQRFGGGDP